MSPAKKKTRPGTQQNPFCYSSLCSRHLWWHCITNQAVYACISRDVSYHCVVITVYAVVGFGTYTYENRFFEYEGEWLNGKKHGELFSM